MLFLIISPASRTVNHGQTTTFTITPNTGYRASATGCGGTLSGNTYTTGTITADCTVTATFTDAYISLPGNIDNMGYSANRVDGYDLIKLSIAFGSKPGDANWNPLCDLDGSSKVDGSDLIVLGNHFGEVQ